MSTAPRRRWQAALAVAAVLTTLAGCSNSNDSGNDSASGGSKFTFWDPYPQYDATSDWAKLVQSCGKDAGVTIQRTGFDTSDLTGKVLLAAQQGKAPNIVVIDNPVISTLADAGVLTTSEDLGLDTSAFEQNLLGAGVLDGKTYGVPIGSNTLALYYNADILKAAGVDPSSITDWDSLNDALAKVVASGKKGITFSAVGTEEGSFQFLPWFWGSGADLKDLSSADAVSALQLWKDWLDKGYAPDSVLTNTQGTAFDEFTAGDYAFVENGTWQLKPADDSGLNYGVISIPSKAGGAAPAPTGGEFVSAPVQKDAKSYATTTKIINCLTSPDNLTTSDAALGYVAPIADVAAKQAQANPELQPWVTAVGDAKARTGDNLGTSYPIISEQMWGAVQNALSGSQSPEDAMKAAQEAAAAKVK